MTVGRAYLNELFQDELMKLWEELPEVLALFAALTENAQWFYEVDVLRLGLRDVGGHVDFFETRPAAELWL